MTTVFLDTVGLLAVWDVDDHWHAAAEVAYQEIMSRRCTVVTSTFVLMECGNAASRRTYRSDVCDLRRALEQRGHLVVPTQDDCERAWQAYERGEAGQAGIVDHVSFIVMRRLGLTEAFTNDRHFQAAGFTTLF
jgi:predicted nucleic acid-binding protein